MKITSVISALLAMCAHELNRAYCAAMGDFTQLPWADAPQWQKDSALAGVSMHLANPNATPEQSHESWLAQKTADGWVYGPVKDSKLKQHPCCVPYAELPDAQKAKDYIFRAAVHSVSAAFKELMAQIPAPIMPAIDPSFIAVTYIYRDDEWIDRNYGTGLTFVKGQTRHLPPEIADKLLRHQDLFERGNSSSIAPDADNTDVALEQSSKDAAKQHDEANALMDLHDSVRLMGKDELVQYALTNFNQSLDKRQKVEAMRAQVSQFLDQFGAS